MHKMHLKLIIGLGNPGCEYKATYHNVGLQFIEFLAEESAVWKSRPTFRYVKSNLLTLAESRTFMNGSGNAVYGILRFLRIRPDECAVVHDESDLEIGSYKFSFGRGAAGHKGVEHITKTLKTKDFWRIRIGIRPPRSTQRKRQKAEMFVLKQVTKTNQAKLVDVFGNIKVKIQEMQRGNQARTTPSR